MVNGTSKTTDRRIVAWNQSRSLNDAANLATMRQSFQRMIGLDGFVPVNLKSAIETDFGAMIVARPANKDTPQTVLYKIPVASLGVKMVHPHEMTYSNACETQEVVISGKTLQKASADLGGFLKFGLSISPEAVYTIRWKFCGFGTITKPEDPLKDPIAKLSQLGDTHLQAIRAVLKRHKTAKCYYINKMKVLREAKLSVKKAKRKVAEAPLDVNQVVTDNGVFSFDGAETRQSRYGPVVLGYWGDEYRLKQTLVPRMKGKGVRSEVRTGSGSALNPVTILVAPSPSKNRNQPSLAQSAVSNLNESANQTYETTYMLIYTGRSAWFRPDLRTD